MNAIQRKIENEGHQPGFQRGLMFLPFNTFGKFQSIYTQGDLANRLFMVKSGSVKLMEVSESGDQVIQDIKTEGEIFGEWNALFKKELYYKNSAVTLSDNTEIHCLKLSETFFENVSNSMADLSLLVLEEYNKMNTRHQRLLNNDAAYRIKEALLSLAQKAGQKFGDETLLKIWLSHEDLSKLADTSRQTVTTVMNDLKNKGKIIYSRDRILFRNLSNIHQ